MNNRSIMILRIQMNGEDSYKMPVEQYADILIKHKPGFIHHPESKRLLQNLLREMGGDLEKT